MRFQQRFFYPTLPSLFAIVFFLLEALLFEFDYNFASLVVCYFVISVAAASQDHWVSEWTYEMTASTKYEWNRLKSLFYLSWLRLMVVVLVWFHSVVAMKSNATEHNPSSKKHTYEQCKRCAFRQYACKRDEQERGRERDEWKSYHCRKLRRNAIKFTFLLGSLFFLRFHYAILRSNNELFRIFFWNVCTWKQWRRERQRARRISMKG